MNNAAIKYAVFDFGEVLFETSRKAMYQELFARKGRDDGALDFFLKNIFPNAIVSQANLGTMAAVTKRAAEKHPEWADEILAFNADREFIKQVRGIIDGMPEVLRAAKAKGYKLYGLTNWAADTFQTLPRAFPEVLGLLDKVVVSGEVGIKKPSPEIFRLAAKEFGSPNPSQVYYYDDKVNNIETAVRTVGWNARVFNRQNGPSMVAEHLGL